MDIKQDLITISTCEDTYRVRIALSLQIIKELVYPPEKYINLATEYLENKKSAKEIADFSIFEDRLYTIWNYMKTHKIAEPITFVIAEGFPRLKGFTFIPAGKGHNFAGTLTITAPKATVAKWQTNWFVYWINCKLAVKDGISVDPSHVHAIKLQYILDAPYSQRVRLASTMNPLQYDKSFIIHAYEDSRDITLILGNTKVICNPKRISLLKEKIKKACHNLSKCQKSSGFILFCEEHFDLFIDNILKGPQRYQIEMPVATNVAIDVDPLSNNKTATLMDCLLLWFALGIPGYNNKQATSKHSLSETKVDVLTKRFEECQLVITDKSDTTKKNQNIITPLVWRETKNQKLQSSFCQLAIDGLSKIPAKSRSIHSLTIPISKAYYPQILDMLNNLRQNIYNLTIESDKIDQAILLNTQIIPLTVTHNSQYHNIQNKIEFEPSWVSAVVRESIGLKDFQQNAQWISQKIAPTLSKTQVAKAFNSLKNAGLIKFDNEAQKFCCPDPNIRTDFEASGHNISRFHQSMILLVNQLLPYLDFNQSELAFFPILCDKEIFPQCKKLINSFFQKLLDLDSEFGKADEIYQLCIQMLPEINELDSQ